MTKYKIFNSNNQKYLHVDNDGQCSWSDFKNASSMTLVEKADLKWAKKQVGIMLNNQDIVNDLKFMKESE